MAVSAAAADWLLAALGDEWLFRAVMAVPGLQASVFRGGFQPARSTLGQPTVRRRVRAALAGRFDRLEPLLREAQGAPWGEAARALTALDATWLRRHWRALLRGTGNRSLAVAMALDARPEIRSRGLRLLQRSSFWGPSWQARPEALPEALRVLAPVPGAAAAPDAAEAAPEGREAAPSRELAVLREALARQREKVRECELLLRRERLEHEEREKELRREVREARAAAEQAAASAEARAARAVAAFREEALGITPRTASLAAAARAAGTESLLERAERVLAEQIRQNELHGTYAGVRARIRDLEAMAERISTCVDESVKVLPEVRSVHRALCREADRLRALLPGGSPPEGELAVQLLARIKEPRPAPELLAELDRLERLLDLDVLAEILGEEGLRQVRGALARRRQLVTGTLEDQARTGTPAPPPRRPREVWDVRAALETGPPPAVQVFVDGYNVIHSVPELAAIESGTGLARSRDVFCELCRRRAHLVAHLEIVFDGQGALSAREEGDGVTVVFSSGARGSQNADEYLLRRVARARAEGGAVWLVTDDRGLRAQAEPYCDAFVACADWHRFLC